MADAAVGAEGGEEAVAVADGPDPLEQLDLLVFRGRGDDLAEGLEVHVVGGGADPAGVAAEGVRGAGVVAEPEAAESEVAVGLGRALLRQGVEGGGGLGPAAGVGRLDRLGEPAAAGL